MKYRRSAYIILFCIPILFVLATAFLLVYNADFELDGDDHELLTSICVGVQHPGLLYQNTSGRFNWSRSEYNFLLLTPFASNPAAFYSVSAVHYLVFSLFTLLLLLSSLDKTDDIAGKIILWGIWLTLQFGTHWTFFHLTQPERLQITLLSAFSYFLLKASITGRQRLYIVSFVIAVIATYCKEPMFGVFMILGSLFFLFRRNDIKMRYFSIGLFINATLYLLLYILLVLPKITGVYHPSGEQRKGIVTIAMALRNSPLLALCLLLSTIILVKNILYLVNKQFFKSADFTPFLPFCVEDALLLSGAAYAVGIIITGGNSNYYFFPTLVLSFPALTRYVKEFRKLSKTLYTVMLILGILIPTYYSHYYVSTVYHRIRFGHRDMDDMKCLASFVDKGCNFCWYDCDNFADISIDYRASYLPVFINYINGTDSFVLDRTNTLPQELSRQDYVICWDEIPEYEAAAYPELPITMFHVYFGKGNDGN